MSKSQHVLLATSDTTPIGLEWDAAHNDFNRPKDLEANLYGSGSGYKLCGCCGANYAENIEQFNTTFSNSRVLEISNQVKTFNRGVLVGINLPINDVKPVAGTVVEHIQCGDDVLSLRLRMEQIYGD